MTEKNIPANAEGLSSDRQIINELERLDVDIHDVACVAGLAYEYFETFQTGKDETGFTVCRMTIEQLNRFDYILRTVAFRAKLLHSDYLKALNGGEA